MPETAAFKVVHMKENTGHGRARQAAIQNCRNELAAIMDADDISLPKRFEKQLKCFVENPSLSIVGGQISEFCGIPENITGIRAVPLKHEAIAVVMKRHCPMNQVTVMLKKRDVEKAGGYREWFCNEDYYLWIRMMKAGCIFANIPDVLVNVRTGEDMIARRGGMRYFQSERRLQRYMAKEKMISLPRYVYNIVLQFGIEAAANHWIRSRLFKFSRRNISKSEKEKILSEQNEQIVEKKDVKYPPFSVAMAVYGKDNAQWFDAALDSIMNQTVKPDEIVLVVDGHVPKSIQDVIEKYNSIFCGGLKVIWLSENSGLGIALQTAVSKCSNEIIARMDSDDIAVLDRFEQQLNVFLVQQEVDIVGGDIQEFINTLEYKTGKRKVPISDSAIKHYMKKRCPFNHMTVMYKKEAVTRAGGYQDLFWNEDYYLWIRMAVKNCVMANTGTVLVNVRVNDDMYMRRGGVQYFKSEKYLQDFMLKQGMIHYMEYITNLAKRFIVQILLPNKIRGWVFRKFARS